MLWTIFLWSNCEQFFMIKSRWCSRRTCAYLLLWEFQNYNSLLNNHWQENVGSHQNKIPHVQGQRRKPQQDSRRGKIAFRIKSHSHQRCSEGSNKTSCTAGDPTETESNLPLSVLVSPVEAWISFRGRGSGCNRPGCGISHTWRRLPLTSP